MRGRHAPPLALAALGMAGLLGLGLGAWLLLRPSGSEGGVAVLRGASADRAAPRFDGDGADGAADAHSGLLPAAGPVEPEALADPPASRRAAGPHRRLAGRVLRASDGTPLEGVHVQVHGLRLQHEEVAPALLALTRGLEVEFSVESLVVDAARVTTDAEGRFELTGVPLDTTEIAVVSDNSWPARTTSYPLPPPAGDVGDTADIEGLQLVFDSGFILEVHVRDAHGTPLPGATVGVGPMEPALTDADGVCVFRDVAPERYAEAAAEDGDGSDLGDGSDGSDGNDGDVTSRLWHRSMARTLGRPAVELWAEAPWFQREEWRLGEPDEPSQVVRIDVTLTGSGTLEGVVRSPAGEALADVEVRALATQTDDHGALCRDALATHTDGEGRYRLDHLPEGRYLVLFRERGFAGRFRMNSGSEFLLVARLVGADRQFTIDFGQPDARALAPQAWSEIVIEIGRATHLDAVLDAGASLAGRVTDGQGAPVAGASLTLERLVRWPAPAQEGSMHTSDGERTLVSVAPGGSTAGGGSPGETIYSQTEASTTTDADGRFRLEHVGPGEKLLWVSADEQQLLPQSEALHLTGREALERVDFVLAAGLSLSGWVRDAAGAAVPGAHVEVAPVTAPGSADVSTATGLAAIVPATTDDEGWFEVSGLRPGPHLLLIAVGGFPAQHREVVPGGPPQVYTVQTPVVLHAQVLDAVTHLPVPQFGFMLEHEGFDISNDDVQDALGCFNAALPDDGPCRVLVHASGYVPVTLEDVHPASTSPAAPLPVLLQPLK